MKLGTLLYYHEPLYNFHHVYGILIWESENMYGLSIKKFKGDYLCVQKNKCKIVKNFKEAFKQRFVLLSNFKHWWFKEHKNIWQYILIETLNQKQNDLSRAIAV